MPFVSWMRRRAGKGGVCPSSGNTLLAAGITAKCSDLQLNVLFTANWWLPSVYWHYRNKHIMKITKIMSYVCRVLQRLQSISINTFSLASCVSSIRSIRKVTFMFNKQGSLDSEKLVTCSEFRTQILAFWWWFFPSHGCLLVLWEQIEIFKEVLSQWLYHPPTPPPPKKNN